MGRIRTIGGDIGTNQCLSKTDIINSYNGSVVENQDGTVSVFINTGNGITPLILTKICCEFLDSSYVFDIQTQKCLWSPSVNCNIQQVFKLVLNPNGNDGSLFYVEPNDNCVLTIDFDYLFKVKCETLGDILNNLGQVLPSSSNNPNLNQLDNATGRETNTSSICESLTNQIAEYTAMINNISYSIVCETLPESPSEMIPVKIISFGSSAFGKSAPFGFGETLVAGQFYCLTEPDGLNQWRTILGDLRYNAFINGDQTSYSCVDVQGIFDLNSVIENNNIINGTNNPLLILPCDTPVNTKSDLLKTLNDLMTQLSECNESLQISARSINGIISSGSTQPNCTTPVDFFEEFDVSVSLDIITTANTLNSVYSDTLLRTIGSGNLYNYLISNPNSGFYVCGDPTGNETQPNCTPFILNLTGSTNNVFTCGSVISSLVNDLYTEYSVTGTSLSDFQNSLPSNAFASQWLHYHAVITDPNIISQIINQKITLSININHTCGDFCVLVDEIVLDKVCSRVDNNNILLTQSPGFGLDRIIDNKKSWLANTSPINRPFVISNNKGGNNIRQTNYDVNDERLVINTKEIDLDISLASAIETDVWCYITDNPCLLTGITTCLPCISECGSKNFQDDECFNFMDGYFYDFMDGINTGNTSDFNFSNCCGDNMIDFTSLMTQPLSAVTTIEAFEYFLTSELIDVKNRQTLSGYPTLRALYDRYMNSGLYCGNNSSMFTYLTMEQFASLIGNYWVDIVEQVIPATTIWGSTRIYSNTIFDQQKFKYKAYSSLFCGNPYSGKTILSPINGTSGECTGVSVSTTSIFIGNKSNIRLSKPVTNYCDSLCIVQMNAGSEFIGNVTIIGTPHNCDINNGGSINENTLKASVITNFPTASVILVGATQPITYLWSNGETGATATMSAGSYTVTVIDASCNEVEIEFVMEQPELVACWYSMQESPEWLVLNVVCGFDDYSSVTFSLSSLVINGVEQISGTGFTTTVDNININLVSANNGIVSSCSGTTAYTNGYTYTNFVDMLNNAFISLGLVNYSAQTSLIGKNVLNSKSIAGFYIIRPSTDTFTIKTNASDGATPLAYHDNDLTLWDNSSSFNYYGYDCSNITIVNGQVIE